MFKKIFLCFVSLFFVAGFCRSEISDKDVINAAKEMENIIKTGIEKMKIPGIAFAVSRNDKIIYVGTFGKTTIESNSPKNLTNDTLFPISSVTKNVTAILVGALVDAGKIDWNDKVRKYLPNFFLHNEELSNELTILDLISHRSGFKHFSGDSLFRCLYNKQKIIDSFKYLKQKPGEFRKYYGYQNIIFGIVGDVLEKATGEKYEDLVKYYIFDKMDMNHSSAIRLDYEYNRIGHFRYLLSRFSHDKTKLGFFKTLFNLIVSPITFKPKDIVINHSRYNETIKPLSQIGYFQKFSATSGVSFSANDYAKWLQMLCNNGKYNEKQIVSPETFKKITSYITDIKSIKDEDLTFVKSRYSRVGMHYGIGCFVSKYGDNGKNEREIIYHMGGVYGATSYFAISPNDNIAVGVICNLGGVPNTMFPEYMVNQFFDLCFGFSKIDWLQADINRKNDIRKKQKEFHEDLATKNPSSQEKLEKYVGIYTSDIYGDITINYKNGILLLDNGIKKAELRHVNGSIFTFYSEDLLYNFSDEDEYASFFKDEYGNINSVYISCLDENKTIFKKKN